MTTHSFSLSTLNNPWAIGFDEMIERLSRVPNQGVGNYPPYNIIKHDACKFSIEIAVAGFTRDELEIELAEGVLKIVADSTNDDGDEIEYLHRGLAKRAFTRKWTLADDVVVNDATLEDGILTIQLERIIPEEKKPRKIEIL